ncbi:Protein phosphatase 1 regulatory subunit 27 [Mizuhopecten yessoensis]|uniref:Protein phosphatase 1 regulatory subunit 27 n=1 Tax=Mizuhopecten yessoensis TaxID=6573 RepID=A0A210PDN0_MIZYE|nr:Protein phosphatase 1 regulatory subunit 27 [Mizuhopecten yessoensis]
MNSQARYFMSNSSIFVESYCSRTKRLGLTPLHQAVLDGNMMAVRLLIEHGANVNKQDEDSWSPLHAACAEGHADIAK